MSKNAYVTINKEGDVEILFEGGTPNITHKVIVKPFKKVFKSISIKNLPLTVDGLNREEYNKEDEDISRTVS